MRNILAVIIGVMTVISALGCDNLYNDITGELNANYFHGTRQFIASDGAASDIFGRSVAISADGSTMVLGSPYAAVSGKSQQGSAYVFRWNGSSWVEMKLAASDGEANDNFGGDVAVSADGNTVVMGATGDDSGKGSAYVFRWNGSSWMQKKLTASEGAANDAFGASVAVSEDGDVVIVGASYDDVDLNSDQGSVYVYRWNGSSWVETKITASDGLASDYFGCSVSVSSDGNIIVVGAHGDDDKGTDSGSAYVYRWNGSSWVGTKLLASDGTGSDYFGMSVSVSADGNTVAVGAYMDDDMGSGSGSVYVYRWNGSSWAQIKITAGDGVAGDGLGNSVAVSADGAMIAVGSPWNDIMGANSGAAYVYRWNGSSYEQVRKLNAEDGLADDRFGQEVAVSQDGAAVVVGAYWDDVGSNSNQGSAWIFAE